MNRRERFEFCHCWSCRVPNVLDIASAFGLVVLFAFGLVLVFAALAFGA